MKEHEPFSRFPFCTNVKVEDRMFSILTVAEEGLFLVVEDPQNVLSVTNQTHLITRIFYCFCLDIKVHFYLSFLFHFVILQFFSVAVAAIDWQLTALCWLTNQNSVTVTSRNQRHSITFHRLPVSCCSTATRFLF